MSSPMHTLWSYRLCPHSRAVRLALGEVGIAVSVVEVRPWDLSQSFLDINPAGDLPVLQMTGSAPLCGAYAISEFLAEELAIAPPAPVNGLAPPELFPGSRAQRAEVRRLVDWFLGKMQRDVSREIIHERVHIPLRDGATRGPVEEVLLAACRANLRYTMTYVGHLAYQRRWIAGDAMSFADIAAAAQLSCLDYLTEISWSEWPRAKDWYARMKSRPAFRPVLAERVPGIVPPMHYTDPDF